MFIWRAKELLEGSGELLRAEIELASKRLRRVLVDSILLVAGLVVAATGAGILLAAGGMALATEMGWTLSLTIIGGGLLGLSLISWAIVTVRRSADHPQTLKEETVVEGEVSPEAQAEEAKERMRNAATPGDDRANKPAGPPDVEQMASSAVEFVAKNPALVGSAAFLALSLVGPGRMLRLVSRGVAAAGLASSLIEALGKDSNGARPDGGVAEPTSARTRSAGRPPTGETNGHPRPRRSEPASTAGASRVR